MIIFATWSLLEYDWHFLAGFLSAAAESHGEQTTIPLREERRKKELVSQSRQAAKASGSQTGRTIISLCKKKILLLWSNRAI